MTQTRGCVHPDRPFVCFSRLMGRFLFVIVMHGRKTKHLKSQNRLCAMIVIDCYTFSIHRALGMTTKHSIKHFLIFQKKKIWLMVSMRVQVYCKRLPGPKLSISLMCCGFGWIIDLSVPAFTCALQKEVLYHGKMYVSSEHICFYSSVLLRATKVGHHSPTTSCAPALKKTHCWTKTAWVIPSKCCTVR